MVYVFLADGFEEMEAVAPIDILRRMNIEVTTVGVTGKTVMGSHSIPITADITINEADFSDLSVLLLPGGMPGATNLLANNTLCELIENTAKEGKVIAALCAAPFIFGKLGLLKGREYTCYPGFEEGIEGIYQKQPLVISEGDYTVITAWGPGAAYRFGFAVASVLTQDKGAVEALEKSMMMCGD